MAALEESIAAVKGKGRQGAKKPAKEAAKSRAEKAKPHAETLRLAPKPNLEVAAGGRTSRQVEVDGRELKLTNLDKVLYPKAGFTKGEMVDYYAKVGAGDGPHLSGRAVTLRRFPEGVDELDSAFFEKRCPKHRPKWVKTATVGPGRTPARSTSASATACRR